MLRIMFVFFLLSACTPAEQPRIDNQADQKIPAQSESGGIQPNILLIMPDDMGYTDIGAFGSEIRTPNIDALAYSGVRLSNFHSGATCGPTRAMLMSGMTQDEALEQGALKPEVFTLPARLAAVGYHTYITGKWQNGRDIHNSERGPLAAGFEKAYVRDAIGGSHFNRPPSPRRGGKEMKENGQQILMSELPQEFFATEAFTDKAIEYIESNRNDGKPWFMWLAHTAPHTPLQVPEEWRDLYKGRYQAGYEVLQKQRVAAAMAQGVLPDNIDPAYPAPYRVNAIAWDELSEEQKAFSSRSMEIYAAMMENLDYHVGRMVDYLKQTGQYDNTIIIFMSDNGAEEISHHFILPRNGYADLVSNTLESLGSADSFVGYEEGWAVAASAPFKWTKGSLTEGGVRVTAFVTHSAVVNKGGVDDDYLTVMDLLPTVMEIAGGATASASDDVLPVRGKSFWSRIKGDSTATHSDEEIIPYSTLTAQAIVKGDWKLIFDLGKGGMKPTPETAWQLFNLEDDPHERRDLSGQYPELKQELITAWQQYADQTGYQPMW